MTMKAVNNLDHILIMIDPLLGIGAQHTVALYYPTENTLEMVDGFASYMPKALEVVRRYKKERNIPAAPVRVLYW